MERRGPGRRGSHPLWCPIPGDLGRGRRRGSDLKTTIQKPKAPDFQVGLFPVHSPLLGESWLVSFPRLSYMLKSRRSSYSNEVRNVVPQHQRTASSTPTPVLTTNRQYTRLTITYLAADDRPAFASYHVICFSKQSTNRDLLPSALHSRRHSPAHPPKRTATRTAQPSATLSMRNRKPHRHHADATNAGRTVKQEEASGVNRHSFEHAPGHFPEAQYAFKILMIH